jgi:hypothetical protein
MFECKICGQEFDRENFIFEADFERATVSEMVVCGFCYEYHVMFLHRGRMPEKV